MKEPNRMVVECPECTHQFETHDAGDIVSCDRCNSSFERFENVVEEKT